MVVWERLQVRPERRHDILDVRLHNGIEELLRQVVDAQLQSPEPLAHKLGRRAERQDERVHQLIQVRQQDTQAYRHRQAQVDEQIAVARISRIQQEI